MDRRIQPYDRKRWFQIHCCRSVVNLNPSPLPDIGMALGAVMAGLLAVAVLGAIVHLAGVPAVAATAVLANTVPVGLAELEGKLTHFMAEFKTIKEQGEELKTKYGSLPANIAEQLTAIQKQVDEIDTKIAKHHAAAQPEETVYQTLEKDEGLKKFFRDGGTHTLQLTAKQVAQLERKTTVTSESGSTGVQTTGVMQIERIPGIIEEARQVLTVRNALTARPTSMQVIDYVKVSTPMTAASPQQGEGHTKKENAVVFTAASEKVQTIATWIPASRQVVADFGELMNFLQTSLRYYVDLAEETSLLSGSGSAVDLNGLITQATAFSTGLLPAGPGWNRIDIIGRVIQQITTAKEVQPTFIVMHPVDWWAIRLTKDTQGRYILGDPMGPVQHPLLFGLLPIVTTSIASGTFLVGSGNPMCAEIRDREGITVALSDSHSTYFTENLVAIRAEKRLALVVKRAASFIKGSFTTSPSGG